MKLGKILKLYRYYLDEDVRTFAARIGLHPSTLCRIEGGKDCDAKTLMRIFNWLTKDGSNRAPGEPL